VSIIKRNTIQRQIILDALIKLDTHPSIEEIYAQIQAEHPSISKTTVYRNLRQLAEAGIIRRVSLPDGLERYDKRVHRHYHFRCRACDCIHDVEIAPLTAINDEVREKHGFQVDGHDVVFSGVCIACQDKQ